VPRLPRTDHSRHQWAALHHYWPYPGTSYTFKVKATDAAGTGRASAPSNPVRPRMAGVTGSDYADHPADLRQAPRDYGACRSGN